MVKLIYLSFLLVGIYNLNAESIDFDIDEIIGFPVVLVQQDSTIIVQNYYASSSFNSNTISGISNPKSIVLYSNEILILDGSEIKRYDKNTLFYLDTIKLNTALNPSKLIKKDLKLIVIDDTLKSIIEFNKNLPYNETTLYSSSITNPKSISYNTELSNLTIVDENPDTTYSVKVINTNSNELLDSIYLSYLNPNSVIEDNYSSIIYTSNYSNIFAIIKDDSTITNQYFIPIYELKSFKNSIQDTNEIIIMDKDNDTLIYYDYRTVITPEFLYPDSTTLITKYGIGLGVSDYFNNNKYHFQLSTSESFTILMIDTVIYQSNIELDSIFDYNSSYFWRVKCLNVYDESTWSESASFSIINLDSIFISYPISDTNLVGNKFNIILSDTLGQFEIQASYSSTFGEIYSSNTITNEYIIPSTMIFDSTVFIRARMIDYYKVANWSPTVQINSGSITIPNLISPSNNSINIDESSSFTWLNSNYAKYRVQFAVDSNFYNVVYNSFQDNNILENLDFTFKDTLYWRVRLENESQIGYWSTSNIFICSMNKPKQIYPLEKSTMVGTMPVFEWFDNKEAYEFRIKNINETTYTDTTFIESKLSLTGIVLEKDSTYEWGVRGISYSSGTIYSNWNTSTFTVSDIENLTIMPIANDNGFGLVGVQMNTEDYFTEVINYQNAHVMLTDRFHEQKGMVYTNIKVDYSKTFSFTYFVKMGDEEYDENGGDILALCLISESNRFPNDIYNCIDANLSLFNIDGFISIEIDTYNNFNYFNNHDLEPDIDTYGYDVDHISLFVGAPDGMVAGNLTGDFHSKNKYVNALKNQENIEDGKYHCVKIDWEPSSEIMNVTFDGELRNIYDLTGKNYINSTSNNIAKIYYFACTGTNSKNRIEIKIGEYIEN